MSARIRLQVVLALVSCAACTCQDAFNAVDTTVLTIDSPANGSSYGSGQSFDYHATATNILGVTSLALKAGGSNGVALKTLNTCTPTGADGGTSAVASDTKLTCDFTFVVDANSDLVSGGSITLTAVALDTHRATVSKTITVQIKPSACQITAPPLTAGTTPPEAVVSGTSALTVTTSATSTFSSVVVKADTTNTLADWTNAGPYTQNEDWDTALGFGTHTLVATCTDVEGNVSSDKLTVRVKCVGDSDCPSGDRCCSNDGTCNPVVAEGADCSCDNPCPNNEGCFPGICGETPAKCYPGCNPGSMSGAGMLPQNCPNQGTQQAFCSPLPTDQVTVQNMGGACVIADGCNVVTQNCPMLPLDRSQPEGPNNPSVQYNCLPVAPNLTGCYPAGTKTLGQGGCDQVCGSVSGGVAAVQDNCAPGYLCVAPEDNPNAYSCEKQCNDPSQSGNPTNECPGGDEACIQVYQPYGALMDFYTTGSCCVPPFSSCTSNSECCGGTCAGGLCNDD